MASLSVMAYTTTIMVITYHGGQCFKVSFGDTTLAFNPISKKIKPFLNDSNYTTGMALSLLAKDVRIVAKMADTLGEFAPISEQCSALWSDAEERFGGKHDQINVARLWFRNT